MGGGGHGLQEKAFTILLFLLGAKNNFRKKDALKLLSEG